MAAVVEEAADGVGLSPVGGGGFYDLGGLVEALGLPRLAAGDEPAEHGVQIKLQPLVTQRRMWSSERSLTGPE